MSLKSVKVGLNVLKTEMVLYFKQSAVEVFSVNPEAYMWFSKFTICITNYDEKNIFGLNKTGLFLKHMPK